MITFKFTGMNAGVILLALSTLVGCAHKKTDHESEIMPVDVAVPTVDSVTLSKTYPGVAIANATAQIMGRVNGSLLSKSYTSGEKVQKGTLLFTIESTSYADAVKEASAALATAKSEYEYASTRYAAMQKALEADAVSKMEVIQAQSDMEQAEALIRNAEAALSTARTNLGYCSVRAPFTGKVTKSTVDPGAYINGEGQPFQLATIYDDSVIFIQFDIEESQYEKMMGSSTMNDSIYRKVPLKFDEPLKHEYFADLSYLSPAVSQNTGTLTLQVKVDNPYGEIKPGTYVTVDLPYGNNPKAILIKDASIATDQLGKYIYTVNDSDKIVYTPIKIGGIYHDSLRVVTEGISPDTRYVTSALLKVRDGMTVKPIVMDSATTKVSK